MPAARAGTYRIVSVDGVAPPPAERPAELILGAGVYGLWDGCAYTEGVAILHERRLFTRGSGLMTLANCPREPVRQRMAAIVSSVPNVASADGRDGARLALLSPAGTLRLALTRAGSRGVGADMRLQPGQEFEIGLGSGTARLTLMPGRFTLALDCGVVTGGWRLGRGDQGSVARFGPDRPPMNCRDESASARAYRFFSGNVLAAIGPNRDIALFVNEGDALSGRVADR